LKPSSSSNPIAAFFVTDLFKIISPRTHILDDGTIFPFVASTDINGEWPIATLNHVDKDVAKEVQEALLSFRDHATALELGKKLRCDTTPELAHVAFNASQAGSFAGFRTARSYVGVRTMQERSGFMRPDPEADNQLRCVKGVNLWKEIVWWVAAQ
jgi:hypothetical protein